MLKLLLPTILFLSSGLYSQPVLSLEEAIGTALAQNYGIQIAALDEKAAQLQVYKSNAGIGPRIEWNANVSGTGNNTKQVFIDGRTVDRWGRVVSPNTSLNLDWTLYDGKRMQNMFVRLNQLSQLSTLEKQLAMQTTVLQVMSAYYDVMKQKETLKYINTLIKYYQDRLNITEERWNVGKGAKVDYLLSQTDLNIQFSDLEAATNQFHNAKIYLNTLLNRDIATDFDVQEEVDLGNEYDLETLLNSAKSKNKEVLILQKNREISLSREREIAAAKKPQVALSSGLGYSYSNSNASFLLTNRNASFNLGLSARWTLYDGHHNNQQIEISKVTTEIIETQEQALLAQITGELTAAYNQYQADKKILTIEENNLKLAEENLVISIEKFRLGGSTILDLNEAQRRFDLSLNRQITAQYNVKTSELELLRLSGALGQ
ncbi:MAG: TolC family protein [Bacteroidia bacterium]|nr:TolC family protein [Bacteroidia bacterium]